MKKFLSKVVIVIAGLSFNLIASMISTLIGLFLIFTLLFVGCSIINGTSIFNSDHREHMAYLEEMRQVAQKYLEDKYDKEFEVTVTGGIHKEPIYGVYGTPRMEALCLDDGIKFHINGEKKDGVWHNADDYTYTRWSYEGTNILKEEIEKVLESDIAFRYLLLNEPINTRGGFFEDEALRRFSYPEVKEHLMESETKFLEVYAIIVYCDMSTFSKEEEADKIVQLCNESIENYRKGDEKRQSYTIGIYYDDINKKPEFGDDEFYKVSSYTNDFSSRHESGEMWNEIRIVSEKFNEHEISILTKEYVMNLFEF